MRSYVRSGSWQGFGNVAQPTLMDKFVLPRRFFDLSTMVNQLRFMKAKIEKLGKEIEMEVTD